MDCSKFEELIESYLDGELEETAEFEAHMTSCENCRDSFNFSKQIRNTIKDLPPITVPTDFAAKLNERLDAEVKNDRTIHMPLFRIPTKYYGMAACALLAVILGINGYELLDKPQIETEIIIDNSNPTETQQAAPTEEIMPAATEEIIPTAEPKTELPTVKPVVTQAPTQKPTAAPVKVVRKTEADKVREQIDNSSYSGRVVLASAVENKVTINEDSVAQAEKDIAYRRDYTLLQEATETGAIANDATLGAMTNVKVVIDNSTPPTGAFGDSVIVYKKDADKINSILNKYTTRPMGEFYVMSEQDYKEFIEELKANGINYTDSGSNKSRSQDVMFKLVIA